MINNAVKRQQSLKYFNTKLVLDMIREGNNISRRSICKTTSMSPTSASRIVGELISHGLIIEESVLESSSAGRKAMEIKIVANKYIFAGIEISVKYAAISLINFSGKLIAKQKYMFPENMSSPEEIIDYAYKNVIELAGKNNINLSMIKKLGIATIGTINPDTGVIVYSDLMKWEKLQLRQIVTKKTGLPCIIDNDVKCALIGEASLLKTRKTSYITMISIGRGVAAASMINGELRRGSINASGEIGHTIIDYSDGKLCCCGRRGCATAYLAEDMIIQEAKQYNEAIKSLEDIREEYLLGTVWAQKLIGSIANYIAALMSNVICFLNPKEVILRGALFDYIPEIYDIVMNRYSTFEYYPLKNTIKFSKGALTTYAASIGAALTAMQTYSNDLVEAISNE